MLLERIAIDMTADDPQYAYPSVHRCRQSASGGFTMVELVIVILILGILAAVATPRYAQAMYATYAKAAAVRVESDLKYARQLAQQNSSNQKVTFDVSADRYTIVTPIGIADRNRRSATYTVNLSRDEFKADISTVDFNGSTNVTFDIYGHADKAGTVVVQSGNIGKWEIKVDILGQISVRQIP
jgi:prepilin-type N-terminal cleavage/methylation domain-containing protein